VFSIETPPDTTLDCRSVRRPTRYRWIICCLLFFATTVNYVDRSVLAVLAPTLKQKIGWTDTNYGDINAAFTAAYAIGLLVAGRVIDLIGVRFGYAIALVCWSLCSIGHALVRTAFGFGVARVCLGFFEAGNFPAAVKTVAEWFPNRERSFAIGLFNSGSNIGAILAPLVVPIIAIHFGWQSAFIATGAAGLIWLLFWLPIYTPPAENPRVSKEELQFITSDPYEATTPVKWTSLLGYRQTWAFSIAKLLTDPIWWFWLFWASPFFHARFGLDLKQIGLPLIIIYNMASVGSVGGGWIPTGFSRLGFSANASRKSALLICALCVLPVMVTPNVNNKWIAVALIGLAAAAHQGFSANLFAVSGDLFPKSAVGSVVGLGGMFGAVGGFTFQWAAGRVVDTWHSYLPLFVTAGAAYITAIGVIQILSPRLKMAEFSDEGRGFEVMQPPEGTR
jgi:MFS transporter, ACS family, hexuronate transporter